MEQIEEIGKDLHKIYRDRRIKIESEAILAIKEDPSYFYSYAKKYSKDSSGIAVLKNGDKLCGGDAENLSQIVQPADQMDRRLI